MTHILLLSHKNNLVLYFLLVLLGNIQAQCSLSDALKLRNLDNNESIVSNIFPNIIIRNERVNYLFESKNYLIGKIENVGIKEDTINFIFCKASGSVLFIINANYHDTLNNQATTIFICDSTINPLIILRYMSGYLEDISFIKTVENNYHYCQFFEVSYFIDTTRLENIELDNYFHRIKTLREMNKNDLCEEWILLPKGNFIFNRIIQLRSTLREGISD